MSCDNNLHSWHPILNSICNLKCLISTDFSRSFIILDQSHRYKHHHPIWYQVYQPLYERFHGMFRCKALDISGKTWIKTIQAFTDQWVLPSHVNVVKWWPSKYLGQADTTCCIGYNNSFTSKSFHTRTGEATTSSGFWQMETPFEEPKLLMSRQTVNKFSSMTDKSCWLSPVWNIRIVNNCVFNFFSASSNKSKPKIKLNSSFSISLSFLKCLE